MKMYSLVALVLGATTAILPALTNAQATSQTHIEAAASAAPMTLPEGVMLVEMLRYYNPTTTDRYSGKELPQNWGYSAGDSKGQ